MGVVVYKGRYLIGKRSDSKEFAPGKWEFISGFVEPNESPHKTMLREVLEETGLECTIARSGVPYTIIDDEAKWINIPFLVEAYDSEFKRNSHDHSDMRWVNSVELQGIDDTDFQRDVAEMRKRGFVV